MGEVAERADEAARATGGDPVANLRAAVRGPGSSRAGSGDPADRAARPARGAGLDALARELDEKHTLGGLRANLRRLADAGRLPTWDVDVLAHMLLAAVSARPRC